MDPIVSASVGVRFSDLRYTDKISDTDVVLVSQNDKNGVYQSYQQPVSSIISGIGSEIKDSLNLSKMAEKEWWMYSLSGHTHENYYSYLSVESTFSSNSSYYDIANITYTDGGYDDFEEGHQHKVTIRVPKINSGNPPAPEIGTIKFICIDQDAEPKTNQELINEPDFDGWVFPNGDTVVIGMDPDISKNYDGYPYTVTNESVSTKRYTIKLCNLSGFFSGTTDTEQVDLNIPQQVTLKQHRHKVDPIVIDATLSLDKTQTKLYSYKDTASKARSKDYIHIAENAGTKKTVEYSVNLNQIKFPELTTGEYKSENQEYKPRHNKMPVMVYIGARRYVSRNTNSHIMSFKTNLGLYHQYEILLDKCYDITNGNTEVTRITYPKSDIPELSIRWLDMSYEGYNDFLRISSDVTISGIWGYSSDPDNAVNIEIDDDTEVEDYYGETIPNPSELVFINVTCPLVDGDNHYFLQDSTEEDHFITIRIPED